MAGLLVKPLEEHWVDIAHVYENWSISNDYLEVVPVDRNILRGAAALRARDKNLKLPDAIHLTTAKETNCRYFLTGGRRIQGQFDVEILDLTEVNVTNLCTA